MFFDDDAHVGHATAADFNIVFVNDFMKLVVGWKVLGKQKELPADVSLHVFAVWRIEPNYVFFFFMLLVFLVWLGSYWISSVE